METQTTKAIRGDFLAWSGGFPPESDKQIRVYVEAAPPADTDPGEVSSLLLNWTAEDEFSNRK